MQKNTKSFVIDGKTMQFDSVAFREVFTSVRKESEMSVLELETQIGDALCVSSNAVHNWRFGMNGPSDVDAIKQLANQLVLSDYLILLKEGKEKNPMKITERQKDSLKRIYDSIIDYLDNFRRTDGFNDYWYSLVDKGVKEERVESMLYEIAEREQHKVELILLKEYIELYKLPVYEQLEEYVYDDLCDIYNGKLSYAYRFEAGVENVDGTRDTVTTTEDYTRAIKKIDDIMEQWM